MRLKQIIGFFVLAFGLGACKDGSTDNFVGEQRYEIVGLHGTVTKVKYLCGGMDNHCDTNSTEVTVEFALSSGCSDFLSAEFTVDRGNKEVWVTAKGLTNVTPGIMCTMALQIITKRLRITNMLPPFHISYEDSGWVSSIQDFNTWDDYQMVE